MDRVSILFRMCLTTVLAAAAFSIGCGAASDSPTPTRHASGRVAAGRLHTCALGADGAVRCWGDNTHGQLGRSPAEQGLGSAGAVVDLGTGLEARANAVFAGQNHNCAVLEGGAVKCWGANDFGQLGLEDMTHRGTGATPMGDGLPTVALGRDSRAVALAPGATATCALLDDGRVKCWGDGYQGALGTGDIDTRGATPGTMGDALPAVDLGSRDGVPLRARELIAIDYHSFCAVIAEPAPHESGLKCWGSNDYCELGIGSKQGGLANEPATTGNGLPFIDLGRTATGAPRQAVTAAAGFQFICVVGDDGGVVCWGDNRAGQLGHGTVGFPVSCDPQEMGDANRVTLPGRAIAIGARGLAAGGGAHACALLDSGQVSCWGENLSGQLGTGDTESLTVASAPLDVGAAAGGDAFVPTELVLGDHTTCALAANNVVKCWGSNRQGQLGPQATSDLVMRPIPFPAPDPIP